MVNFSTSLVITELRPNAGLKEIVIETPTTMIQDDALTVTLADYGLSDTGLLVIDGYQQSTANSVVISSAATTLVIEGVLTISTVPVGTVARIYRVVGRSR